MSNSAHAITDFNGISKVSLDGECKLLSGRKHCTEYILISSNKMQQYASIYLRQNHSTCFGCPSFSSSGVHKTVTAALGTGHSI